MAVQDLTPQLRTRLSKVERAVGVFVVLATLLLLAGFAFYIYSTAQRKGWFKEKFLYHTYVESAGGIRVGDRLSRLRAKYGDALHERRSDVSETTRIFEFRRGRREIHFDVFNGNRVRVISTGIRREVDFSEGCA